MIIQTHGAVPSTRQTSAVLARHAHPRDQPRAMRRRASQAIAMMPIGKPIRMPAAITVPYRSHTDDISYTVTAVGSARLSILNTC
ncbi:hypothetical protein [Agromyces silvae]|uniref:hypothetical protein n=1 Tax=Agromyces silvae TaxID=3388266 RepID=UPI00280B617B|nr:hypothetical protein [Agromyces protaetiae]